MQEFPDNWTESTELEVYVILFIIVVFLLVLNFILAIIVEGYALTSLLVVVGSSSGSGSGSGSSSSSSISNRRSRRSSLDIIATRSL